MELHLADMLVEPHLHPLVAEQIFVKCNLQLQIPVATGLRPRIVVRSEAVLRLPHMDALVAEDGAKALLQLSDSVKYLRG
jgi:hypothetical protein